jgi:hypothetical protein
MDLNQGQAYIFLEITSHSHTQFPGDGVFPLFSVCLLVFAEFLEGNVQ